MGALLTIALLTKVIRPAGRNNCLILYYSTPAHSACGDNVGCANAPEQCHASTFDAADQVVLIRALSRYVFPLREGGQQHHPACDLSLYDGRFIEPLTRFVASSAVAVRASSPLICLRHGHLRARDSPRGRRAPCASFPLRATLGASLSRVARLAASAPALPGVDPRPPRLPFVVRSGHSRHAPAAIHLAPPHRAADASAL